MNEAWRKISDVRDAMDDYKSFGEYHSSNKGSAATFITFLLVGAGIGALTALLLAPKTGKQVRRTLRRKYEDARDRVEDWGDHASDYFEKGSKWASAAADRVRPIARAMRRD